MAQVEQVPNPETFVEPVGYYIEPLVWVGAPPAGISAAGHPEDLGSAPAGIDFDAFGDVVVQLDLLDGRLPGRIERDGLVVFDFAQEAPRTTGDLDDRPPDHLRRRLEILNAHQACLLDAYQRLEARGRASLEVVSPSSLLHIWGREESPPGAALPRKPSALSASMGRHRDFYASGFDFRLSRTDLIGEAVAMESLQLLDTILNLASHVSGHADLLFRAAAAHADHNFSLSVVQSWTVSESILRRQWDEYLQENRTRDVDGALQPFINVERRKRLTDSPDVSASLISEMLSLVDELPLSIYHQLGEARKARNQWLHSLAQPSPEASANAHKAASDLLLHAEGVSIQIPPVLSW